MNKLILILALLVFVGCSQKAPSKAERTVTFQDGSRFLIETEEKYHKRVSE